MSKHQPVQTLRFGLIKASIWRNNTPSGDRHVVTVVRLYRNGDVWKESTRFGRDDLLLVAKIINAAHTWILEQSKPNTPNGEKHSMEPEHE